MKEAIAATIRNSEKQSHLVKDGNCLAKVMSLLNEDVDLGVIFCGKMVALLRTCFVAVHQRREELARDKAMIASVPGSLPYACAIFMYDLWTPRNRGERAWYILSRE